MIQVSDFPALTDDLQSIFDEVAARKIADNVGFSVFDVFDTDRRTYDHLILHGVAGIKRVTPGQDLPKVNSEEGDTITFTQEYFGAEADVTKEMRMFDLYDQIEGIIKSLVTGAFDDVDQSFADVLTGGWGTSYTDVYGDSVSALGPDGLKLFHTTHTNPLDASITFSNVITDGSNTNPALTREAIVHWRALGRVHKDPAGKTKPINYNVLIVPPALEDLANRLVNSQYLPGSANNDINPLKGTVRVVMWERLQTASDGTDASAYWFMADDSSVKESLKGIFAERPSLDAPEVVYRNKNWAYSCDFFYVLGRGYPAYISGSKGDES